MNKLAENEPTGVLVWNQELQVGRMSSMKSEKNSTKDKSEI